MDSVQPIDDVYQPQDDGGQSGECFPDMAGAIDEPNEDQLLDAGYSPPERPRVLGRFGTTETEVAQGESWSERERQAEPEGHSIGFGADLMVDQSEDSMDFPDPDTTAGEYRAGRLATVDGECCDVGVDGGAATAEEAAMHIVVDGSFEPLGGQA